MIIEYLIRKIEPCTVCEWECCKATYCHEHSSYECCGKFWYRTLRLYLFLEDKWWLLKYYLFYIWFDKLKDFKN